jgi:hypothetical protein
MSKAVNFLKGLNLNQEQTMRENFHEISKIRGNTKVEQKHKVIIYQRS